MSTGDPQTIAKLRLREKALLASHEATWIGGARLAGYRFGRGFIDHVLAARDPHLSSVFRVHMRSLELSSTSVTTLESSLLAQCRQLRVILSQPAETAALIDRLGGIGEPGAISGGLHGELVHLRELAVRGLADAPSALDRLIAAPRFARLEALDLHGQPFDIPGRIVQVLQAARLRELRLGLNQAADAGGLTSQRTIYEALARTPAAASLEIRPGRLRDR